ncbi:hypothetical protein AGMMS49992_09850 [Clostridia bacterium]|nr:hypothetical protein AGMMS49992_09850 [Clostridia bacterium]
MESVVEMLTYEFFINDYGEAKFKDGFNAGRRKMMKRLIIKGYDDAFIANFLDERIEEVTELRQEMLTAVK